MKHECDKPPEKLGLLAYGTSGSWDVSVDESLDGNRWFLEIEGPQTYLTFRLRDLEVIPQALHLLHSCHGPNLAQESTLELGQFGSSTVTLVRDNEDFPRCFL